MENPVTVATFDFVSQADSCKLLLEENGVHAYIADNNLIGMDWFLSNAIGGIKLQVEKTDANQAKEIIEKFHSSKVQSTEEREDISFACQECGKIIAFPGHRAGGVETCPFCDNYVDVPGGNESSE